MRGARFVLKKGWPVDGTWCFELYSKNGRLLMMSGIYSSKQNAEIGIRAVKKYALDAPVVEK